MPQLPVNHRLSFVECYTELGSLTHSSFVSCIECRWKTSVDLAMQYPGVALQGIVEHDVVYALVPNGSTVVFL